MQKPWWFLTVSSAVALLHSLVERPHRVCCPYALYHSLPYTGCEVHERAKCRSQAWRWRDKLFSIENCSWEIRNAVGSSNHTVPSGVSGRSLHCEPLHTWSIAEYENGGKWQDSDKGEVQRVRTVCVREILTGSSRNKLKKHEKASKSGFQSPMRSSLKILEIILAHCQCTVRTWRGFAEDWMPVSGFIYGIRRRRIAKSQWTKKDTRGLWPRSLEVVSSGGNQADPIDSQETRVAIEWFGKLVLKIQLNWDHWTTISVISGEAAFKKASTSHEPFWGLAQTCKRCTEMQDRTSPAKANWCGC